MDYPKEVVEALERDCGIRIKNPADKKRDEDTRFVYGATCTWFGSIHEVSATDKHPRYANEHQAHSLPCCPICGGMLFEMESASIWWDGVDGFEKGTDKRAFIY